VHVLHAAARCSRCRNTAPARARRAARACQQTGSGTAPCAGSSAPSEITYGDRKRAG
jgi:hypothetical protein